eukprot:comp12299_c0_seq1/m.7141 comp12299_c0_seq1/g.7141  ORF comp12299_c0_seq1/g.7141 comp12299_c0_seq1/m.7141 type:complete len:329 (-) comp12299_c0_seq1:223-1209(-)
MFSKTLCAVLSLCALTTGVRLEQHSPGPANLATTTTTAFITNSDAALITPDEKITRKVSIIVPTYKEQPNIAPLCERVFAATRKAGIEAEMIIVDDNSKDGSVETVTNLHENLGYDISIVVRKNEKGLSTAVLAGFDRASNDVMLVMDADLQHPPETVPDLLVPIFNGSATFSLGSRNVAGGGVSKDWGMARRVISHGATMLALPLVSVSDPMSGFFAIHKKSLQSAQDLNPLGFKIALELMVKCENMTVVEVPFTFVSRTQGESKLKLKTQVQYLRHLAALYWHKYAVEIVFIALLAACVSSLLAIHMVSLVMATQPQRKRSFSKHA